ncbi:MAG: macrolide ABC transporter ATP-binding protein [Candidatus Cloacimonadota bacterium]|nr:MAG: macrolide ABC transporter ATP-binding protein [Candidatus Cloacimonadota bacterium]
MAGLIEVKDLKKEYKMGKISVHALNGVDIDIQAGDFVAIMGPSGSGKSTLMHILGCLDSPTKGQYTLNKEEVSNMRKGKLASIRNKEIGFVFQTFNLLPHLNVQKNVELPLMYGGFSKKKRTAMARKVLNEVGLGDRLKHKPSELSGGQRQRVAIARAIVNNPAIILADEPTGNLDTNSGNDILSIFSELHAKGNTIIIVTHDPAVAKRANKIINIVDGLIQDGDIT